MSENAPFCYFANVRERQALIKFKHALNATKYTLTSWVGENCCLWEGAGCNNKVGYVIKLNLRGTKINLDFQMKEMTATKDLFSDEKLLSRCFRNLKRNHPSSSSVEISLSSSLS
ncbi:LRR receptor-like serine/threonine-protein kinase GSO1 [Cinnamomum micranthum f. kanehirae]|uniref:LRR receptor-like serine/threonine-protein kinase GSO1 n=1 Tax=Cinnamomum micranthum f. kanehirae TaxID=337451 RepID=A0A443PSS5_9MAGN|nr:LRR receptor-like serine/threonine-protein kinase GSO1 [Cinnamomum micranthum f. kanehirae]